MIYLSKKNSIMKFNLFSGLMVAIIMSVVTISCGDDEPEPQTIAQIVADDNNFSSLLTALERANLTSVLSGVGPFTVFAPTNQAFTSAGINVNTIDVTTLTNVLLYHVIGGASIQSTALAEGQTYASSASASGPESKALSLLIERTGTAVKVNNIANVTTANVTATNGTIHIVDNVLLPLDIVGHAAANANFTSLVGALGAAAGGLVNVLSGTGPFTVFAPVNSAFSTISAISAGLSPTQLAQVLTYHVVGGNVVSSGLSNGMSVTTVNGQTFTVNISNSTITLTSSSGNVAKVLLTDVQATNGVIHVLETVIIPNLQ